ncbi:Hpt domain-containing protein [Polaribacter sp. R77954]|uniref:Hpt domain-containing protein n=1 Tax=Polaribacter sp. R77954 TaxID=3093870 RepID=UPI0037CBB83E
MEIDKILTSNVVDVSSVKSFFGTDKDMLIQLINVYLLETTPRLKTLENNLNTLDFEEVRSVCHFLKSSFGLMGISCLEEIIAIEQLTKQHENENLIKEKLRNAIPICKESIVEYKSMLTKLEAL